MAPQVEIQTGERVPVTKFATTLNGAVKVVPSASIFDGKRVLLFAVPGPFTPGCTQIHLPGMAEAVGTLRAKGIDTIACIAVASPYVMEAWKQASTPNTEIVFLSDHTGEFTRKTGMVIDTPTGILSKRYAFVVDNGALVHKLVDHDNKVKESSAESVLAKL